MPDHTNADHSAQQETRDDFDINVPHSNEDVSYIHRNLREIVNIHEKQFEKLLYKPEEIPLELAELLEQVGNRYLDFSVEISDIRQSIKSKLNRDRKPNE